MDDCKWIGVTIVAILIGIVYVACTTPRQLIALGVAVGLNVLIIAIVWRIKK